MEESKAWYQSTGVWGGVVAIAAGGLGMLGYEVTPADQANVANALSQAATLLSSAAAIGGGLLAIWGRVRASKTIASKTGGA